MKPCKNKIITVSEAETNFSELLEAAEADGHVIICQKDGTEFVLTSSDNFFELTDDEKIDIAAKRIMKRFKPAFKELAK